MCNGIEFCSADPDDGNYDITTCKVGFAAFSRGYNWCGPRLWELQQCCVLPCFVTVQQTARYTKQGSKAAASLAGKATGLRLPKAMQNTRMVVCQHA